MSNVAYFTSIEEIDKEIKGGHMRPCQIKTRRRTSRS